MEPQKTVEKNSPFILPLAIILAGGLIGAGVYFSNKHPGATLGISERNRLANVDEITVNPVTADDYILGNPNAPVVIIEFSDTECPYCKTFHTTMQRVMDEYGTSGKVAWVYRHFPIPQLHPQAAKQAEATECAGELGGNEKFWEFTNELYRITPSNNGLRLEQLPQIAETVGLDVARFESCLESGRHAQKVQDDYADAVRSGGGGTPHSILVTRSGEKISIKGAQPYDVLKTVIDTALTQQGIQ